MEPFILVPPVHTPLLPRVAPLMATRRQNNRPETHCVYIEMSLSAVRMQERRCWLHRVTDSNFGHSVAMNKEISKRAK